MEIIARVVRRPPEVGTGARSMDRELWINNLRVENFPQVLYKEEAHVYFFVKGGIPPRSVTPNATLLQSVQS